MQNLGAHATFSPSDLNHFLECEHLIQLERRRDAAESPRVRDAHAELLAAKGLEHEQAWLARFRAEARSIVDLGASSGERDWKDDARRTLDAMQRGADVIYQGVLVGEEWRGISDFLVRVHRPSRLGDWSYEAWDTKLARHSKPYFILQLCYYTEQLAALQGVEPTSMHVVLGTGRPESFAYREFAAYYRAIRRRFLSAAREGRSTSPYPLAHCGLCRYKARCEHQWRSEDHLSLVAGIRRQQVERLNEAGVTTVAQLATFDSDARIGIGANALRRLVHQAAMQTHHRRTGEHRYELLPVDAQSGFRLLPPPSPGDIFFDMEGYPFYAPDRGLEYLFGFIVHRDTEQTPGTVGQPSVADAPVGQPFRAANASTFHCFHASNPAEEKLAFEQFIDLVHARLRQWPDLHVYHYAAYEPATLKRLMSEHATREEEMDDLLRREVFVDLYQVVRQSLRISHPSYSIKKVRTFFMAGAGQGAVADGADSILEFERWLRTRDPGILEAIERYNEEDCLSTIKLLEWLLERKQQAERESGQPIPWKTTDYAELSPARVEDDEAIRQRCERLQASDAPPAGLLATLLNYHRREAKPEWWAYFERQKKSLDDLLDDTEAISYLEAVAGIDPQPDKRSLVYTLAFPPQEFKLGLGAVDDPFARAGAGTIVWLDAAAGRLGLKRSQNRANEPLPRALVPGKPLDNGTQRRALCRVADDVIDGGAQFTAVRALLSRELPRLRNRIPGSAVQTLDLAEQKALVEALDDTCLFIQGPPGSGKTWTGARLIVSLLAKGKRVGVAANSHKAIHNLLDEVEAVAANEGVRFSGLKKCTEGEETVYEGPSFASTTDNRACETSDAQLIAGTSWLFAREGMHQRLDYLFIDEAGQVSLADAAAMGTAANNIVLLGDPQQLPHVTQGIHPEGSGCSVLEHLLGSESTVPENRGIFLARSWRMHPDVCAFVSDLAYDGRLSSAANRDRQRVDSPGLSGAGLRYMAVNHNGNAQQSPEEASVIHDEVRRLLLDGTFTDDEGRTRPLTGRDILVVAPYNMQVRTLREVLPPGVEVGTVDKFQGREAPVVFFSMTSSSGDDVPRGLEFLFSRNRVNVAISRAKALAVLVVNPRLLEARCRSVGQMRLLNGVCLFTERAGPGRPADKGLTLT